MMVRFSGGILTSQYTFGDIGGEQIDKDAGYDGPPITDRRDAANAAVINDLKAEGRDHFLFTVSENVDGADGPEMVMTDVIATDLDARRLHHASMLLHLINGTYTNMSIDQEQGASFYREGDAETGDAFGQSYYKMIQTATEAYEALKKLVFEKAQYGFSSNSKERTPSEVRRLRPNGR